MKKLLLSILLCSPIYADTITLNAQSFPPNCQESHRCDLHAVHDIEIINNDTQNHLYTYSYELCADNGQCVNTSNTVWVGYHSKWNNHHDSYMTTRFEWSGTHIMTAKTIIDKYIHDERIDQKPVEVK
jgi:hypothetical protein